MYIFIAKLLKYYFIFNHEIFYKIIRVFHTISMYYTPSHCKYGHCIFKIFGAKISSFYYLYGKIGLPAQIVWLLHKIRNIHYEQLYNC